MLLLRFIPFAGTILKQLSPKTRTFYVHCTSLTVSHRTTPSVVSTHVRQDFKATTHILGNGDVPSCPA